MDLHTVSEVVRPRTRAGVPAWREGDAYLAGGTWLFSEPQAGVRRLIDLTALGWPALAAGDEGLTVAATCTLAALEAFEAPEGWRAAAAIGPCCRALLGSFKIRHVATVGGNLCLALAAAPMAALMVALHGVCTIWTAEGGERALPAEAFLCKAGQCALAPGEILRAVALPADVLRRRASVRQMSLTAHGRSAALLVGTRDGADVELTVAAATARPVRLRVEAGADAAAVGAAVEAAVPGWYDDPHGRPAWRRRITLLMAAEICAELSA